MNDQQGPAHDQRSGRHRGRKDQAERQWHELTGSGHTQLSATAAMRARDADQPDAADLARAEAEVVIQRRHWQPGT